MTYEIMDVSESEEMVRELMEYARNCPFQGTGSYLAELLAENAFEGYEGGYLLPVQQFGQDIELLRGCTKNYGAGKLRRRHRDG